MLESYIIRRIFPIFRYTRRIFLKVADNERRIKTSYSAVIERVQSTD